MKSIFRYWRYMDENKKEPVKKKSETKVTVDPHPGGRPSKYQTGYCQLIVDVMKKGESIASFCAKVGVGRQTYLNWREQHEEFLEASQLAIEFSQMWWEKLMTLCATGQIRNYEIKDEATGEVTKPYKYANAAAIMFMLSRRFPDYHRKVMQDIELTGDNNKPLEGGVQIYLPENGR